MRIGLGISITMPLGGVAPDAPDIVVPGSQTTNEDTSKVINGISIIDTDSETLSITLSVLNGTITLASTTGLSFSVGADNTDNMVFSGSLVNVNAALNGLTYVPTPGFHGGDTLAIATSDGALSDSGTIGITVSSVNDASLITVPGAQSFAVDSTNNAVAGISIADADTDSQSVTLSVSNGTLTLSTTGLSFTVGDGTADASMAFSGTLSVVNTALSTLTYTPTGSYSGSDTIAIGSDDGNGSTDSDTIAITVASAFSPADLTPVAWWRLSTGGFQADGVTQAAAGNNMRYLRAEGAAGKYFDQPTGGTAPLLATSSSKLAWSGIPSTAKYMRMAGTSTLITRGAQFSFSMWIKGPPTSFSPFTISKTIFGESNTASANPNAASVDWNSGPDTATTIRFNIRPNTSNTPSITKDLLGTWFDNNWHHLVWTDDNGVVVYYRDGVAFSEYSYTRPAGLTIVNQGLMVLPRTVAGGHGWNGFIGENFVIDNKIWTQSDVDDLYAFG